MRVNCEIQKPERGQENGGQEDGNFIFLAWILRSSRRVGNRRSEAVRHEYDDPKPVMTVLGRSRGMRYVQAVKALSKFSLSPILP